MPTAMHRGCSVQSAAVVGDAVGESLGLQLGLADGEPVGGVVGVVGDALGLADGLALGDRDGLSDGDPLGETDGDALGEPLGLSLGLADGLALGLLDGLSSSSQHDMYTGGSSGSVGRVGQHCPTYPRWKHETPGPFAECEAQLPGPMDGDALGLALGCSVLSQQSR